MGQKLERIERDLGFVNETVALHARYHLTMAPPMPQAQQRAACILGLERFERKLEQIQRDTRERVDQRVPADQRTLFDYGGYLSLNYLSEQSLAVGSAIQLKILPERIRVF